MDFNGVASMRLFYSTSDLILNGQSYEDFPILLDSNMEIVTEVMDFLIYHCITRGRVESKHTWRSVGQSLYDYFLFLELHEKTWENVDFNNDHSILAAYRPKFGVIFTPYNLKNAT